MTRHVPFTNYTFVGSLKNNPIHGFPSVAFYNQDDHLHAPISVDNLYQTSLSILNCQLDLEALDTLHRPPHAYNDPRLAITASMEQTKLSTIIPDSWNIRTLYPTYDCQLQSIFTSSRYLHVSLCSVCKLLGHFALGILRSHSCN